MFSFISFRTVTGEALTDVHVRAATNNVLSQLISFKYQNIVEKMSITTSQSQGNIFKCFVVSNQLIKDIQFTMI